MKNILVGIKVDLFYGTKQLNSLVKRVSEKFTLLGISSIFKVVMKDSSMSYLYCALKLDSEIQSEAQILNELNSLYVEKNQIAKARALEIVLLAVDEVVRLTPSLTLPHPDLVGDPAFARCALEVWPDYFHPIMKEQIKYINVQSPDISFEFLSKGPR